MEGYKCNNIISNNPQTPTNENVSYTASLLEGAELFFNKLISRDSSKGLSSCTYYYQVAARVPFDWELRPGKPKNPPKGETIPPLSPPPALLGSNLAPLQCTHQPMGSNRWKGWSKKMRKSQRNQRSQRSMGFRGVERSESFGFGSIRCEGDFTTSARNSSSSFSSSSCSLASSMVSFTNQTVEKCSEKRRVMDSSDEGRSFTAWRLLGVLSCMHWQEESGT